MKTSCAWRSKGGWRDVRSDDINDYVRLVTGGDFTAKDFRTWRATVVGRRIAGSPWTVRDGVGLRRAIREAMEEVAESSATPRRSPAGPTSTHASWTGTGPARLVDQGAGTRSQPSTTCYGRTEPSSRISTPSRTSGTAPGRRARPTPRSWWRRPSMRRSTAGSRPGGPRRSCRRPGSRPRAGARTGGGGA